LTDIPIIFSAPMVLALLAGRKTMTRRLARTERKIPGPGSLGGDPDRIERPSSWQKVKAGDRLWVRENHWRYGHWVFGLKEQGARSFKKRFQPTREPSDLPDVVPAADADPSFKSPEVDRFGPGWHLRPSIFMPREHSRLTLVVTGTKEEPLQNISAEDAIAEGVQLIGEKTWGVPGSGSMVFNGSPVDGFCALWQSLHGIASWHNNPEVVATSFQVVEANIDEVSPRTQTHVGALARSV
jgi:hypothetical protein